MTDKTLFRRVLDAMLEGREKQARRYIDAYLRERSLKRPGQD